MVARRHERRWRLRRWAETLLVTVVTFAAVFGLAFWLELPVALRPVPLVAVLILVLFEIWQDRKGARHGVVR